ncbi:MAG: N-acetylmuramoyl-L-alanine amidase [Thermodesulfobacteriota bacterium]
MPCLYRKETKPLLTVCLALLFMVLGPAGTLAAAADLADKRYNQAASYYNNSCGFSIKELSRSQWQECLRLFAKAHDSNPKDQEVAPKALFMMAKIYGKSYEQFGMREDLKASAAYYEKLSLLFPNHSLADDALVALGKIVLNNKGNKDVVNKERLLAKALAAYGGPDEGMGHTAGLLLKRLQEHSQQRSGDKPPSKETLVTSIRPASHAAHITRPIRFWSNKNYTRVVIEASAPVRFKEHVLKAEGKLPSRLYVDLFDCRIPSTYQNPITIQDGLLKRSRAAQFDPSTARVVIDLETFSQYKIFSLHEPFRVVIDITGTKKKLLVPLKPLKPRKSWDKNKEFTLAEQLGLGVKTIVIDAGHGGKDPGAIGRKGLREKDVVLKVALKTRDALRKKGYKVILTRSSDKFLPLEERTAIANTKNADLFLSIHANSAPNRRARGLETYYLSLATTKEEKQAAALENAVSSKQLSELQSILSDIMKSSKIDESRKFAGTVQRSLASGMKKRYGNVKNLGVKKAPFFVLIGAQMPSVLAEIAFLSNKEEEKRLRSDAYLAALASELANGVEMYSRSLQ